MRLAIILAEYGKPAPDVTQYRETWPEADIQVFSGSDLPDVPQLDPKHPRYGWRMNDYYKVRKMLDSGADVAMCFDGDMRIVDREAARTLPLLAERFGICLPINPRYTVRVDMRDGADVMATWPEPFPVDAPGVNCSPIAISLKQEHWPRHAHSGTYLAEAYCKLMLAHPQRGPLVWWHAMWATGDVPLILPPQWCVCERHIGCGNEIILHTGHQAVARHYKDMPLR